MSNGSHTRRGRRAAGREPAARSQRRGGGRRWWLLGLAVLALGAAIRYRIILEHVWAVVHGPGPSAVAAVAPPAPPPCWAPLPPLNGQGLALARGAAWATIEQLTRAGAPPPTRAYKVPARLVRLWLAPDQSLELTLASLVNPGRTLVGRVPAGHCVANGDDAALFDELREDIGLRFGTVRATPRLLPHPVSVVVTGIATAGAHGIALEPVLNVQVQ